MPVVGNKFYNDPALGQAFSNLAGVFAPPSGSDMAGYAAAKAKREEAGRLAELFNYARDPNYNQATADRLGVLGGLYAPNQSYYSVDMGDATTRRGQDVVADTSRANNSADNARALDQTRLTNTKDVTVSMLAPVAEGATRFVPGSIADMYAVPEQQTGVLSANQGETLVTPGGRTVIGQAKPLTEEEVKGGERTDLRTSGKLTDEMILDTIVGKETPVQTVGPDNKPVYMSPGQAVRNNAPAYNKPANDTASEVNKLISERDALPPGDPNRAAYDARLQALGRGQQQSAYDQAADKDFAALNTSIFDSAKSAFAERGLYKTVLAAVDNPNVDQGTLAQATLGMRKALNAFGVNAGNTAPAELLNALGGQISLKLRNQDGANMPGAMSDADREFLKSMSVSLGNSPDANKLLAQYYLGIQQRAVDLNDLRQDYVSRKGRVDEGFRAEMADYLKNADPTAQLRAQLAGGAPTPAPGAAPAAAPAAAAPQPVKVTSPEEAAKLPSGTPIILPDGTTGRVP